MSVGETETGNRTGHVYRRKRGTAVISIKTVEAETCGLLMCFTLVTFELSLVHFNIVWLGPQQQPSFLSVFKVRVHLRWQNVMTE